MDQNNASYQPETQNHRVQIQTLIKEVDQKTQKNGHRNGRKQSPEIVRHSN